MTRRLLPALAAALTVFAAPVNAQARQAGPVYAVISLVGDQVDAVTYKPQVGTLLDANTHEALGTGPDILDTVALRAANKALRAALPVSDVALLAATEPKLFADEARYFVGDHVQLPPDLDAAIQAAQATRLVLITKHRGDARLRVSNGLIGSGKIEGLGFYLDTDHHIRDSANLEVVGFLAPFVYVDVTLVDTGSHTVVRKTAITASETVTAEGQTEGAAVWDALTGEQKVASLSRLLSDSLAEAIPQLVKPPPLAAR
jgi:hypothetical protein